MLAQLLTNRNNNKNTDSNHNREGNLNIEPPKTDKSKESFSIVAEVIGIQTHIAS